MVRGRGGTKDSLKSLHGWEAGLPGCQDWRMQRPKMGRPCGHG